MLLPRPAAVAAQRALHVPLGIPIGYVIAAAGPLLVGVVREATGDWSVILPVLMVLCALMAAVGFRAARNVSIDEELAAHA